MKGARNIILTNKASHNVNLALYASMQAVKMAPSIFELHYPTVIEFSKMLNSKS